MIRVGTDCSGIEAPIVALHMSNIPFHHVFGSEIDENCRKVIRLNFSPLRLYRDITERDHSLLPGLDLYVAGFPCQAFSGMRHDADGFNDPRGTIFFECLETIRRTRPRCFILENVAGLLSHDSGNTMKTILHSIRRLRTYHVFYKILNSIDYNLPQNRPRVYIVGIRKDIPHSGDFQFPQSQPLLINVSSIMDRHARSSQRSHPTCSPSHRSASGGKEGK